MQNTQLCSTIVQLSFSPEQLELMFTFPLIYSIFQLLFALLILGGKVYIFFIIALQLSLLLSVSFFMDMKKIRRDKNNQMENS